MKALRTARRIGSMLSVIAAIAFGAFEAGSLPATAAGGPALRVDPAMLSSDRPATRPTAAAVAEEFVVRRILPIEGPLHMGDWHWDETGAPDGPIVITVDLAAQTLSVFRSGYEIGTAAILYGADSKPTPLGAFPIREKDADHVSNLYDAPMPYMLRLTKDGVSIHGSEVKPGTATHGCIGVPVAFAKRLFGATKLGDVVIITRGKMLQMGDAIVQG